MKVKVLQSYHGHILPGMIGETTDSNMQSTHPKTAVVVTFKDVENMTTKKKEDVTVSMARDQLEEYNGN